MMFGMVLRVIGSNVKAKCFLTVFWTKTMDKPPGIWVKQSNMLKLSV